MIYSQQRFNKPTVAQADSFTFKREDGRWYIHLPRYLAQGWSKEDLQMTEGAHKFLNRIANGRHKVRLCLSTVANTGCDRLELIEHCAAPKGGGLYGFVTEEGTSNSRFWICDLALLLFGDIPDRIYVQRVSLRGKLVPEDYTNPAEAILPRHPGYPIYN